MPRAFDYSNPVSFYKIVCNDPTVTEFYVGSTTNLIKRRSCHKSMCNSGSSLYVYEFIRENNGWNNWTVLEIISKVCIDKYDMLRTERNYMETLGASLNKIRPIITKDEAVEEMAEYRLTHKEQRAEYNAAYRDTHTEQLKANRAIYRATNSDKIKAYRATNKEQIKATSATYAATHKEQLKEYNAARYLYKKTLEELYNCLL